MIWLQLCLVLILFQKVIYSQNYDITIDKISCENQPQYICQNISCSIRPVKRFVTNITAGCILSEPLESLLVRMTLYYKLSEYRKFLIDVEEDLCGYLNNTTSTKVMNILASQVLPRSNFDKVCPIKKGYIWIRNVQVDTRTGPPFIPIGQYRLDLSATNKAKTKVYYSSAKVYFSIHPKRLFNKKGGVR